MKPVLWGLLSLIGITLASNSYGNDAAVLAIVDRLLLSPRPIIASAPVDVVIVNTTYTYDVEASSPAGLVLTYSLEDPPSGMTINSTTGVISWTPIQTVGSFPIKVVISDGNGGIRVQVFTLTIKNQITYQYDSNERLTGYSATTGVGATITPDAAGNTTSRVAQ